MKAFHVYKEFALDGSAANEHRKAHFIAVGETDADPDVLMPDLEQGLNQVAFLHLPKRIADLFCRKTVVAVFGLVVGVRINDGEEKGRDALLSNKCQVFAVKGGGIGPRIDLGFHSENIQFRKIHVFPSPYDPDLMLRFSHCTSDNVFLRPLPRVRLVFARGKVRIYRQSKEQASLPLCPNR